MERYSKQTPLAFTDGALFTSLPFFHPDYTVGVGFASRLAHRTPASGVVRHPLAGLPTAQLPWITADRELGFHPHPALKVLS